MRWGGDDLSAAARGVVSVQSIASPLLRVTVDLPPSTNNLYACVTRGGKHRRVKTARAEQYTHDVGWAVLRAAPKLPDFDGPLVMFVRLFFKDGRRRDLDNVKCLIDALASACKFDDSQIVALSLLKARNPTNPRCEVEIGSALDFAKEPA